MLNKKTCLVIISFLAVFCCFCFAQTTEESWNDYLHYAKIGSFELAIGHAKNLIESNPNPVELLALSEKNQQGYTLMLKMVESSQNQELSDLSKQILAIIDKGRFERRTDPKIIVEEVKRLSSTDRGRLTAVKRLKDSGEYSVMYLLDAMMDSMRKDELGNIIWALPQIGKDSLRPLAAAMMTNNVAAKAEIIKAMGKIGYPHSLAYLKYVAENDSSSELKSLAVASINQIDASAMGISSSQLFYNLAQEYYKQAASLAPAEDANFANIWFWDTTNERLYSEKVDKKYFYELMAMRNCEWSVKADPEFGSAIGLWLAAFFKAESTGLEMPKYFGQGHADAYIYATTAGPEYLYQALTAALTLKDTYTALGVVEAIGSSAGEKSLSQKANALQPLINAMSYDDKAVNFSAALAIASVNPGENFTAKQKVAQLLGAALSLSDEQLNDKGLANRWSKEDYVLRAAKAMLKLAQAKSKAIDLSAVQSQLIDASKSNKQEIKIMAANILAYIGSADAQKAIAAIGLDEAAAKDLRIAGFNALALSGKQNGSMLDDAAIDSIYNIVASASSDSDVRSAAASAFGSLNLPSAKVKKLVIDQSKN